MSPVMPAPDSALMRAGPFNLLCEVPVPLRVRFADDLWRHLARHCAQGGEAFSCHVPMGQGGPSPLDRLRDIRDPLDFPRMLVSARQRLQPQRP